jgi:2-dehydropantoate 2-reductase
MKVLVYGAGVIGCYLAHVLCRAKNEVTLLARGEWKKTLERNSLTIHHHLQRKITTDSPKIVEKIEASQHYDAVFSAMPCDRVSAILDDLAAVNAPTVVLVGNNLSAVETELYIRENSTVPKQVLFAFQGTAGKRERDYLVCERVGGGNLDIGFLYSPASEELKRKFAMIFHGTQYHLCWHDSMENFLKCHAAAILPIAYLAYITDCDYKKSTKAQRKMCLDASSEGYNMLLKLGYSIVPKGSDDYYRSGAKRLSMQFVMYLMSKTVIGELMAAAHCRHAVREMEELDKRWCNLRERLSDFSMPNWDALRKSMPDWETLRKIYSECCDREDQKNIKLLK